MPGLLARVSPEILTSASAAEPVPETLLPDLVRRARAAQRRRTRMVVAIAAAAVLVVSAGAVTAAVVLNDDEQAAAQGTPSEPQQEMKPLIDIPIAASVSLTSVDWGTRLELTCTYGSPGGGNGSEGWPYAIVVETREGEVEQVGTWLALPGREMTLDAATATRRDDIASVEVRTTSGRPVLELEL